MSSKYPRTPHLPFSPGKGSDDKVLNNIDYLLNTKLVITEKMDGSNVCMTKDSCFARSHSSSPKHESFDAFKAFHANLKHQIDNMYLYGEWLYAVHSIKYTTLDSYFMLFGIRIEDHWLSWKDVKETAFILNINTVPIVVEDIEFKSEKDLESFVSTEAKKKSFCGDDREGLVVRLSSGYNNDMFSSAVSKWVRPNHVTTDTHWKFKEIEKNLLKI